MPRRRRLVNLLTARIVAFGGALVIATIALMFFYLLWVVAPMFAGASVETGRGYPLDPAQTLLIEANESQEFGLRVTTAGEIDLFDLASGELRERVDMGRRLRGAQRIADQTGSYALQDASGGITFVQAVYPVSFDGENRIIRPMLQYLFEPHWHPAGDAHAFDVYSRPLQLRVATLSGRTLIIDHFRDAEPGFALETPSRAQHQLRRDYDQLFFGPRGQWLYLISDDGAVEVLDIARPEQPTELHAGRLVPEGARINAVAPLLGRNSLLIADAHGGIAQWFMVRSEFGWRLQQIREFHLEAAATHIIPEPRRKGFAVIDAANQLHLLYTTSRRHLASHPMAAGDVATASIAPRADLLLTAAADGSAQTYRLRNAHPEISWSTLWSKVWYEGYPEPVYSWQSSAADTDFEPKFSLTPLLFGTLKGAFYAMLFAVPIAVMG
ncbi:MAG: hypothetical protein ACNA7W_12530, partial [Pseudomonadales bacterium]